MVRDAPKRLAPAGAIFKPRRMPDSDRGSQGRTCAAQLLAWRASMIATKEVPSDLCKGVANWENEGGATGRIGASGRIDSNKDAGRCISPFVLPVIFFAAIAAGIAGLFYDRWQQVTARAGIYSPWRGRAGSDGVIR